MGLAKRVLLAALAVGTIASAAACGEDKAPPAKWTSVGDSVGGPAWRYPGVTALAAAPGGGEMVAGLSGGGLWISSDGGGSWTKLGNSGEVIPGRPQRILFDPKEPKTLWVSASHGPGFFKSSDGGRTFARVGEMESCSALALDLNDPQRQTILLAGYEQTQTLYKSTDGGKNFTSIGENLPGNTNYISGVVILDAKTWLVGCNGTKPGRISGIFRTEDAGATWQQASEWGPAGDALVAGGAIYWSTGVELMTSKDVGKSWVKLVAPVQHSPILLPGGRAAAVGDKHTYFTADAGKNWHPLGPALPFAPLVGGLAYSDKLNAFVIAQATEKKSADGIAACALAGSLEAQATEAMVQRLVVWNGEKEGSRDMARGGGWVHPKDDVFSVKVQGQEAHGGKQAVQFHGEGDGWMGFGWNWLAWTPGDGGDDARNMTHLVFWMKYAGAKPTRLDVRLATSSNDRAVSEEVSILAYCPTADDGQWHEVRIPLSAFVLKTGKMSMAKLWEIDLGVVTEGPNACDIYLDDVGFEQRPAIMQ